MAEAPGGPAGPHLPVAVERTLRPHPSTDAVPLGIAWSPGGAIAAGYDDGTVRLWRGPGGGADALAVLDGSGAGPTTAVGWSADGRSLAAGDDEGRVSLWETTAWRLDRQWSLGNRVEVVAWSPDDRYLAAGTVAGELLIWDGRRPDQPPRVLLARGSRLRCLAWAPDGGRVAYGDHDGRLAVAHVDHPHDARVLEQADPTGAERVCDLAWSPQGWLARAGRDGVAVWDPDDGTCLARLEGHGRSPCGVATGRPGLLATMSPVDLILWRTDTWDPVWRENHRGGGALGVAFHPALPRLAVRNGSDIEVRRLDVDALTDRTALPSVTYTTAKIVLVGDSGGGKSGLGHRLVTGTHRAHDPTHGQQSWPLRHLGLRRDDGTECEAVLWELAGQPDHRLTHSLFLDDAELVVLVFDPTARDPLAGVDFWCDTLNAGRDRPCASVLVGARVDRGSPALPLAAIEDYCARRGIGGGYIETSALTGAGLDELVATLKALVPWDELPPTTTTLTFRRMTERLRRIATGLDDAIVEPGRLRTLIEEQVPGDTFTDDDMMAAARLLQRHGHVAVLPAVGDDREVVLLRPDLLRNLAASIVVAARRDVDGLGAIDEAVLVPGGDAFPQLADLPEAHRAVLLGAVTQLLVQRTLCFRAPWDDERSLLVFPDLIRTRRPDAGDEPDLDEETTYRVCGAVQNAYAAVVVVLGDTNLLRRTGQWSDEAHFEVGAGGRCVVRQSVGGAGGSERDLTVLFDRQVTGWERDVFRGLVEGVLRKQNVEVERIPPLDCGRCGGRQAREAVIRRQRRGSSFLHCEECGERIEIPSAAGAGEPTEAERAAIAREERIAAARSALETALTSLMHYGAFTFPGRPAPTCFVSYAWGDPANERWVGVLARDLRLAGIDVRLDQDDNAEPGSPIAAFVEQIDTVDRVIVVGTPAYLAKASAASAGHVVRAEMQLVNDRLIRGDDRIIPVLREGTPATSLPPLPRGKVHVDLSDDEAYFPRVFDLALWLLGVRGEPALAHLRDQVRQAPEGA